MTRVTQNLLHIAASGNHPEIIKLIAPRSAALIEGLDHEGHTPLFLAASEVNSSLISALCYFPEYLSQHFRGCGQGHTEALAALIECGARAHPAHNPNGFTPLHAAVINNKVECVHLLLNAGAAADGDTASETPPPLVRSFDMNGVRVFNLTLVGWGRCMRSDTSVASL